MEWVFGVIVLVTLPMAIARLWRLYLCVNHPQTYERYREWEDNERERKGKTLKGAANGGMFLYKLFKR